MLRFSDFAHLPEIDGLVQELIAEQSGLILVAGLDSRPALEAATGPMPTFLPSGRATIFRVLVGELLEAHPRRRCVVVGEDRDALHIARRFKSRVETVLVKPPLTMDEAIRGHSTRPGLLVIDRLAADNLGAALAVARAGGLVVSQVDTLYCGSVVARYLLELGATDDELTALRWVLSIQRLPALCPICKQPATVSAEQLLSVEADAARCWDFDAATSCLDCQLTRLATKLMAKRRSPSFS